MTWTPGPAEDGAPRYLALADAIARDVETGRLRPGDRLPPQRRLAERIGVDFTTVSRGYAEARARGLVEAHVGRGTFVAARKAPEAPADPRRVQDRDLTMNLPPEPQDPELLARMQGGLAAVSRDLVGLLRYQSATGGVVDKEAASSWLSMRGMAPSLERVAITPGAHPTIFAILMQLAKPGDVILCEAVTYAGIRGIAARLGLRLVGIEGDADGILPDALREAARAHGARALYLNPTLNNPTTRTIPEARRLEIAAALEELDLPLIEDDAYGFIPQHAPPALATMAPGRVWHVGGLAKCIGAGLRLAYTVAPDPRAARKLARCLKTTNVMPSPLCMALATRWIQDGTADAIRRFIRAETAARQKIAAELLQGADFDADPNAFNIWLRLPPGRGRAQAAGLLAATGIGVMPADAFTVEGAPQEALRICLGGDASRAGVHAALSLLAEALDPHSWYG
ncbi:PLP-dependent aminotransferase family protein [Rhodovulum sp. DZ06]|uniref:aminotransferase-like domain-containing protein n=1 Tax=Rhodovulum sp. DZ06 TaxID=3425126 RepID=UPI003D324ADB